MARRFVLHLQNRANEWYLASHKGSERIEWADTMMDVEAHPRDGVGADGLHDNDGRSVL